MQFLFFCKKLRNEFWRAFITVRSLTSVHIMTILKRPALIMTACFQWNIYKQGLFHFIKFCWHSISQLSFHSGERFENTPISETPEGLSSNFLLFWKLLCLSCEKSAVIRQKHNFHIKHRHHISDTYSIKILDWLCSAWSPDNPLFVSCRDPRPVCFHAIFCSIFDKTATADDL